MLRLRRRSPRVRASLSVQKMRKEFDVVSLSSGEMHELRSKLGDGTHTQQETRFCAYPLRKWLFVKRFGCSGVPQKIT
jgi:hypothetical protein